MSKTPSDTNGDLNNLKDLERFLASESPRPDCVVLQQREKDRERTIQQSKREIDRRIKRLDNLLRDLEDLDAKGKDSDLWKQIEAAGYLSVPILSVIESLDETLKRFPKKVRQTFKEQIQAKIDEIYRISWQISVRNEVSSSFYYIDEEDPEIIALKETWKRETEEFEIRKRRAEEQKAREQRLREDEEKEQKPKEHEPSRHKPSERKTREPQRGSVIITNEPKWRTKQEYQEYLERLRGSEEHYYPKQIPPVPPEPELDPEARRQAIAQSYGIPVSWVRLPEEKKAPKRN